MEACWVQGRNPAEIWEDYGSVREAKGKIWGVIWEPRMEAKSFKIVRNAYGKKGEKRKDTTKDSKSDLSCLGRDRPDQLQTCK